MIPIVLSERIQKTASKLPSELREKCSKAIAEVGKAFGEPHRHRGLGLRKLAARSYEVRVALQWRVVFLHIDDELIAYDIMNHDQVVQWLKRMR